jgi:hypothetical protein
MHIWKYRIAPVKIRRADRLTAQNIFPQVELAGSPTPELADAVRRFTEVFTEYLYMKHPDYTKSDSGAPPKNPFAARKTAAAVPAITVTLQIGE